MMAEIRVTGGRDPYIELLSLWDWLTREDAFRGRISMNRAEVPPGQMGSLDDVLAVAVGTGGAVTVLANSISVWLTQRRADVKIEVRNKDGRAVTVTVDRAPDAAKILAQVLDLGDRTTTSRQTDLADD